MIKINIVRQWNKPEFFKSVYADFIPNGQDGASGIFAKLAFIISIIFIAVFTFGFAGKAVDEKRETDELKQARALWYDNADETHRFALLKGEYGDFAGWIRVPETEIDLPVMLGENDEYYRYHSFKKQKRGYGAIGISGKNGLPSPDGGGNTVMYGNAPENGTMFGSLKRYRELDYYLAHSVIDFCSENTDKRYRVFAVLSLDGNYEDESGSVDFYRNSFSNEAEFDEWFRKIVSKSRISSDVTARLGDGIITLCTYPDTSGETTVVMARELGYGESAESYAVTATVNAFTE